MREDGTTLEDFLRQELSREVFEDSSHEYMSNEIYAVFVKALSEWKKSLIEQSEKTMDNLKSQDLAISDLSDQATQEESFAFYLKERDRERKLIKKIDEALSLIEKGEYGFCCACGVEIGYERLLARLTATMCVDCKSAQESLERHKNT